MPYGRLSDFVGTLRFRLMAWNTAVLILIGVPTLAGVHAVLRHKVLHEFDELLQEDLEEIRLAVRQRAPLDLLYQELERKAQGHVHHRWFVQIFDGGGEAVWSSQNAPDELPPLAGDAVYESGPYRLVETRIAEPGRAPVVVRVGSSLRSLQDDVTLLTRMLLLACAFILLLAPLGGYWLAGRATKPLGRIIRTTAHLRPSNLAERLPVRGSGDELDQLAVTINGFLDRIGSYLDRKRDFLANAAHELRSPLTAICTSVEVALDAPRSPQEYTHLLGDILEESQHLRVLVNQMLQLAESETEHLTFAGGAARLDEIARQSVEMFRGVADSQGVSFTVECVEVETAGDAAHVRQVVNNLVDNAVKFNRPGGRVDVAVGVDAGQAVLRVADTGRGIAAADLPRVFERFFRTEKSRSRYSERPGNGLGLSICEAVVTALQGTIGVESELGRGSVFTVRLPLAARAENAGAGAPSATS